MTEKTILNSPGLEVRVSDEANEGILDILNHTIQGSEGGLRFSLQNPEVRIKEYKDKIRFVSLYRKNKVTGTLGACFRVTGQDELKCHTTYIRYFAFNPVYQTESRPGRKKHIPSKSEQAEDSFKKRTLDLFSKPQLLDYPDISESDKHIMY